MEITEVIVRLMERRNDKLKAFCSVTFDNAFVVRDLKVIDGAKGAFVAMPSRKLTDHCPSCRSKTALRDNFCCSCGAKLETNRMMKDRAGRIKYHADIAHPINPQCREMIQQRVLKAYQEESGRAQQPGYKPKEIYESGEEPETESKNDVKKGSD